MINSRILVLGAALASPAFAQLPDIAIVAAASNNPTDCRFTDVQTFLMASGQFGNVDVIDGYSVTPTLGTLSAYDGVITWSNYDYEDPVTLGDNLADYVDQGGAVVVALFANTTGADKALQGRWLTGYELLDTSLGNATNAASLGAINNPGHPTVAGVTSLDASAAFRPYLTTPILQGDVIAEWSDGAPLIIADGPLPKRVDIGLYPPSSNCSSALWQQGTSGDVICTNALLYAIGGSTGGTLGTNYCAANPNSTGSAASISATGSRTASDNDVTLSAAGIPPMQFGIFVTSQTQAATPLASGILCVGGSIIRFQGPGQILQADANGEYSLQIDTQALPAGIPTPIMPGDTYNFTTWFRDVDPMIGNTANFSDGLEIEFN